MAQTPSFGEVQARRVGLRLAEFALGLLFYAFRIFALAPILAAAAIGFGMMNMMTGLLDFFEPSLVKVMPEERQEFHGGLMEFGLPLAVRFLYWGFILSIPLNIVEQFTNWKLRERLFRFKYWALFLCVYFAFLTVFGTIMAVVNDRFEDESNLTVVIVLVVLNAVLFGASLSGFVGLFAVNWTEDAAFRRLRKRFGLAPEEESAPSS